MTIAFPVNGLSEGQVYEPPSIPNVKYTYNSAKQVWVGANASTGGGTGGGSTYVLPQANDTTLGGVRVDNKTVSIDPGTGVLSASSAGSTIMLSCDFGKSASRTLLLGAGNYELVLMSNFMVIDYSGGQNDSFTQTATLGSYTASTSLNIVRQGGKGYGRYQYGMDVGSTKFTLTTQATYTLTLNEAKVNGSPIDPANGQGSIVWLVNLDSNSIGVAGGSGSSTPALAGANCVAWVNFDGKTAVPSLRGSYNVGSVTKLSAGRYQINFSNAIKDANYGLASTARIAGVGGSIMVIDDLVNPTATACTVRNYNTEVGNVDVNIVSVAFFR